MMMTKRLILLTGSTGFIGGRLLPHLKAQGFPVRCLVRQPSQTSDIDVVQGDLLDVDSVYRAMQGVDCAYYLVHSMSASGDYSDLDRQAAKNFAEAASQCGVRRIIYVGGLGENTAALSKHLRSRHEVGEILCKYAQGVEVIELRCSIVLGTGGLSFEMIRALCERLPVMITPKWTRTLTQPIGLRDLLDYLIQAIDIKVPGSMIFEIGGVDKVSYSDLMHEYCRQRGLKLMTIPVSVLSPRLSSLWLYLFTPLYTQVGRKLIDSACYPTVVTDDSAKKYFQIPPLTTSQAIAQALNEEDQELAASDWVKTFRKDQKKIIFLFSDVRTIHVPAPPSQAFVPISQIGGTAGWYYGNWLWSLRGMIDTLAGGVGLRRGRKNQEKIEVGDVVDFWKVEKYVPERLLRLSAEMKLPGKAWLEFDIAAENGGSTITQIALFQPKGVLGRLYWYLLYPIHCLIFKGMLRGIASVNNHRSDVL